MRAWFSILLAGTLGTAVSFAAFSATRDWKVLALCSLITVLAIERFRLIYQRAARVERLVQERTQDLSRTNAQLEEDRRWITVQYAVTRVLSEEESLHDAAPRILKQICETLGWEVGAIWGLDRAANALRCEEFWSSPLHEVAQFEAATRKAAFPRGLGLPGRVWDSRKPAWIPDVTKDNNFPHADAAEQAGLHAAFAFPIRLGEEISGVVEFFNDQIQQPDEQLLGMMDAVGSQIGQFIERKHLEKFKDEFVSTVSHEMRTPLSITKEGISLVLDRIPGEINPEQEAILTTARGNIDRLARIINDLLDISRLEAGRVHLRRERVEIGDLFRQVAGAFGPRAAAKGLSFRVSVPEQEAPIHADPDKVMEILTNLVDNAIKFTDAGQITLSARPGGEKVECAVEDTGAGISTEDLPRVFGKFEQFSRAPGAGARGTGLGLAIVKRLVELHHGTIQVESQPKKGTRFLFTLPSYLPQNVLQGLIGDKVHEATVKGTKLSLLWMTAAPAGPSEMEELERLIKRKACRREDRVIRMPKGLALLAVDCDREAALKIQSRCERLLRAALERKGPPEGIQVHCEVVVFPDGVRTAEELFSKIERWHRQLDEPLRMAG
jgi:signal transduction histidine kinase